MKTISKNFFKSFLTFSIFLFLGIGFGLSIKSILATWDEPTIAPPSGNTDKPLTTVGGKIETSNNLSFSTYNEITKTSSQSTNLTGLSINTTSSSGMGGVILLKSSGVTGIALGTNSNTYGYIYGDGTGDIAISGNRKVILQSVSENIELRSSSANVLIKSGYTASDGAALAVVNNRTLSFGASPLTYQGLYLKGNNSSKATLLTLNSSGSAQITGIAFSNTGSSANGDILTILGVTSAYKGSLYMQGNDLALHSNAGSIVIATEGTNPVKIGGAAASSQKLNVAGNVLANAYLYNSDKRLKDNIQKMKSNDYLKILDVNSVTYEWKDNDKKDMGVIAQELEKIYPEMVYDGQDGYKSVDYVKLIVPMIEMIKEQQKEIDELKNKIK